MFDDHDQKKKKGTQNKNSKMERERINGERLRKNGLTKKSGKKRKVRKVLKKKKYHEPRR